eukprot:COSAG04_NODE_1046_length_8572_cov_5.008970_5_plen_336_part_00
MDEAEGDAQGSGEEGVEWGAGHGLEPRQLARGLEVVALDPAEEVPAREEHEHQRRQQREADPHRAHHRAEQPQGVARHRRQQRVHLVQIRREAVQQAALRILLEEAHRGVQDRRRHAVVEAARRRQRHPHERHRARHRQHQRQHRDRAISAHPVSRAERIVRTEPERCRQIRRKRRHRGRPALSRAVHAQYRPIERPVPAGPFRRRLAVSAPRRTGRPTRGRPVLGVFTARQPPSDAGHRLRAWREHDAEAPSARIRPHLLLLQPPPPRGSGKAGRVAEGHRHRSVWQQLVADAARHAGLVVARAERADHSALVRRVAVDQRRRVWHRRHRLGLG